MDFGESWITVNTIIRNMIGIVKNINKH